MDGERELAVVTGASSGIGFELARCCAADYDLLICSDTAEIELAAERLRSDGAFVETVQADLATRAGVEALWQAVRGRKVGALLANVGTGLGGAFLDQDLDAIEKIVAVNVTHTLGLVHRVGRQMRAGGHGRILITGSIAGGMPGSFNAVYNASKAFMNSFAEALRDELKDSGVTVTCLMPGLTDTRFFERAEMQDSTLGRSPKADPARVASDGYSAMRAGRSEVVSGLISKVQSALSNVVPDTVLARLHRVAAKRDRDT